MKYIQIESNFSFKKLAGKVDSIVDKYKEDVSGAYAQGAKDKIDKNDLKELRPYTKRNRKNQDMIPLYDSGDLYKSLKGTKKGLEMLSYGADHQKGYPSSIPNAIDIPARKFFGSQFVSKEGEDKAKKSLIKNIRKGMKLLFLELQLAELVESYEFIEEEPINEEYIAELSEKITERVYKDICKALKKDKFKFRLEKDYLNISFI